MGTRDLVEPTSDSYHCNFPIWTVASVFSCFVIFFLQGNQHEVFKSFLQLTFTIYCLWQSQMIYVFCGQEFRARGDKAVVSRRYRLSGCCPGKRNATQSVPEPWMVLWFRGGNTHFHRYQVLKCVFSFLFIKFVEYI